MFYFQAVFKNLTYYLIGDDQGPTFFRIDPRRGLISVNKDLKSENVDYYRVSITSWTQQYFQ